MKVIGLVLAIVSFCSACAQVGSSGDVTGRVSAENAADCDREAREVTRFGTVDAPAVSNPWSGASQWVLAPDRASFGQMMRDSQYQRCLEAKAARLPTERPR